MIDTVCFFRRRLFFFVETGDLHHAGKGRVIQQASVLDLLRVESFIVLPRRRLNDIVIRIIRLEQDFPLLAATARTACTLGDEVEGLLGGKVAWHIERPICRKDTDRLHAGDIMSLGHHLRAEKNIYISAAEFFQNGPRAVLLLRTVYIEALDACFGKCLVQILLDMLRTTPEVEDLPAVALRTFMGQRMHCLAVMAFQLCSVFVIDQRNIAIRAFEDIAAVSAHERRREAAAVQKKDGLLFPFDGRPEHLHHRMRQRLPGGIALEVIDMNGGKLRLKDAVLHFHKLDLSRLRRMVRRDRRRRGAEDDRAVVDLPHHLGRITPIVAGRLPLLVRGIILFIDDDELQITKGHEDRRTRADDDRTLAIGDALAVVIALALAKTAVNEDDLIP